MTRVFVYEYTSAALPASLEAGGAASLCAEGAAMLGAALADFARVPGVEAIAIRTTAEEGVSVAKVSRCREPSGILVRLGSADLPTLATLTPEEEAAFRVAARWADWSLVIAPEFDQILETRCRWVLEEGGQLLGPSPPAVRLCADKLALFHWWKGRGVRTPETREWNRAPHFAAKVALKPRFGAGGRDTSFGSDFAGRPDTPLLVQPFIEGRSASVAFLVGTAGRFPLRSAAQTFADKSECEYLGGYVPLPPPLEERARRIAAAALDGLPGLFGYVGVDVILGDDGRDWAIEINPRLTTSYIGLRRLAVTNLAEALLRVARGEVPAVEWHDGTVEFAANGDVAMRPG